MKILHLAAGNRWTGAAAPAFAEVEALREAGVDAHYAYVGGYKLQQKIGRHDFAHPLIEKAQNPMSFTRSVEAVRRMIASHGFDYVHAHLTYDHWLARFAAQDRKARLARTFHSRRTLRNDPFTRSLAGRSTLLFVVNDTFRQAPLLSDRQPIFTPPPIDLRQFSPQGPDIRAKYGVEAEALLLIAIGKLAPRRGFEEALAAFAVIQSRRGDARLMIIGHGEHRAALERNARELGIDGGVIWAGYHEDDLAEHYRAANVLLFTAAGSDEGHRAVLEAMACGTPPATYPIHGLAALFGELAPHLIAASASPGALADRALSVADDRGLSRAVAERSTQFDYASAARRLMAAYLDAL